MRKAMMLGLSGVALGVAGLAYVGPAGQSVAQEAAAASGATAAASTHEHAAAHSDDAAPLQTLDVSLDQAHRVIVAAIVKAHEIDTKMNIAVVDAGGNLKAFVRMDGAWLGSIDIKKATTARNFDMNTGVIGELSQPGGPLYGIEHSNGGLITFPGGVPLKAADGTIIGAVGVSGSSVENDHAVATAAAEAL